MSSASKTERHGNWRTQAAFDLCLTILCHARDRNSRRSTASHDASVDQRASSYHEPADAPRGQGEDPRREEITSESHRATKPTAKSDARPITEGRPTSRH